MNLVTLVNSLENSVVLSNFQSILEKIQSPVIISYQKMTAKDGHIDFVFLAPCVRRLNWCWVHLPKTVLDQKAVKINEDRILKSSLFLRDKYFSKIDHSSNATGFVLCLIFVFINI